MLQYLPAPTSGFGAGARTGEQHCHSNVAAVGMRLDIDVKLKQLIAGSAAGFTFSYSRDFVCV